MNNRRNCERRHSGSRVPALASRRLGGGALLDSSSDDDAGSDADESPLVSSGGRGERAVARASSRARARTPTATGMAKLRSFEAILATDPKRPASDAASDQTFGSPATILGDPRAGSTSPEYPRRSPSPSKRGGTTVRVKGVSDVDFRAVSDDDSNRDDSDDEGARGGLRGVGGYAAGLRGYRPAPFARDAPFAFSVSATDSAADSERSRSAYASESRSESEEADEPEPERERRRPPPPRAHREQPAAETAHNPAASPFSGPSLPSGSPSGSLDDSPSGGSAPSSRGVAAARGRDVRAGVLAAAFEAKHAGAPTFVPDAGTAAPADGTSGGLSISSRAGPPAASLASPASPVPPPAAAAASHPGGFSAPGPLRAGPKEHPPSEAGGPPVPSWALGAVRDAAAARIQSAARGKLARREAAKRKTARANEREAEAKAKEAKEAKEEKEGGGDGHPDGPEVRRALWIDLPTGAVHRASWRPLPEILGTAETVRHCKLCVAPTRPMVGM